MDALAGFPFHSNDDRTITIFLQMKKRLDPDFSVQSVAEIHIIKFEAFDLPGFHAIHAYHPLWYFSSAVTGDGTQKAEWIMQSLPRVQTPRLLNRHMIPDHRNHVAENTSSGVELQLLPSYVSALALEIMSQKIQGLTVCNYQVAIGLVTPEIMLQKTCFSR